MEIFQLRWLQLVSWRSVHASLTNHVDAKHFMCLEDCGIVRGGGGGAETALGYEMYREPVFVRAIYSGMLNKLEIF